MSAVEGENDGNFFFSLEMKEGASAQEVAAVRSCLRATPNLRDLTENRVTYQVEPNVRV